MRATVDAVIDRWRPGQRVDLYQEFRRAVRRATIQVLIGPRPASQLIYSPYVTHRLPELWPDPLRFDPVRWDPDRTEARKPGPHEFLPFGGGPHRCLGAAFASIELTVLLERLLQRVSSRLEPSDASPVGLAAMRPRSGPFARILAVS